jgi:hypothetical protein
MPLRSKRTFSRRSTEIKRIEKLTLPERTLFCITVCWNRSAFGLFYVSLRHCYTTRAGISVDRVKAFTFPENPPREKVLGNFVIPKDTTVIVDAFAINIRNPFWGPDNRAYRPQRFAGIKQNQVRMELCFIRATRKRIDHLIAPV